MKLKLSIFIFVFSFLFVLANGQVNIPKQDFKIIGYYSLELAMTADPKEVPFDELTHLNLYFLNPDTLGNFNHDYAALIPFIKTAHAKHVKVLVSIGGGGRHPYYAKLLKDDNRAGLINNLLSIVLRYDLDGIDVDLEGDDIDENYDNFVIELGKSLRQHNKLMTAAVAVFYKGSYTDKVLAQFDFVSIMSYDHTGPWTPDKPGPHSTYAQAVTDLNYFATVRSLPEKKMVLGVPFYGYGFGPTLNSPVISMDYGQIVSTFPGSESADQWTMPDGKTLYYNGIPMIEKKTILAKQKASGIMIWQLSGDAKGSKSLLKAINEVTYNE